MHRLEPDQKKLLFVFMTDALLRMATTASTPAQSEECCRPSAVFPVYFVVACFITCLPSFVSEPDRVSP